MSSLSRGRYICRLSLADILHSELESIIVTALSIINEGLNQRVYYRLWYKYGDVTSPQIKSFIERYNDIFKTISLEIKKETKLEITDTWFDVARDGAEVAPYRYKSIYQDDKGLLISLFDFYRVAKFVSARNTTRKTQK